MLPIGIVGRKSEQFKRWVKEVIEIGKQGATINGDEGNTNLVTFLTKKMKKSSTLLLHNCQQEVYKGLSLYH